MWKNAFTAFHATAAGAFAVLTASAAIGEPLGIIFAIPTAVFAYACYRNSAEEH